MAINNKALVTLLQNILYPFLFGSISNQKLQDILLNYFSVYKIEHQYSVYSIIKYENCATKKHLSMQNRLWNKLDGCFISCWNQDFHGIYSSQFHCTQELYFWGFSSAQWCSVCLLLSVTLPTIGWQKLMQGDCQFVSFTCYMLNILVTPDHFRQC